MFRLSPQCAARLAIGGAMLVAHALPASAQPKIVPETPASPIPASPTPAGAPTRPVPPTAWAPPKPTADETKKFLAMFRTQQACKTPLDLSVQNATLDQIAAQVRQKLPRPAPLIEVRGALPVALSFDLKKSTAGAALRSAGALAGAKLWVFSDRLLLAPANALSAAEQSEVSAGTASQSAQTSAMNRYSATNRKMTMIFSALVVEELKAKNNGAKPAEAGKTEPSLKTTFDQLSPDAQAMMQQLVSDMNESFALSSGLSERFDLRFTISSNTLVEVNPSQPSGLGDKDVLQLSNNTNGTNVVGWELSGMGSFARFGGSRPTTSPSPASPPPPVLDPSAHKS